MKEISTAPVKWQKLKYHGLNGDKVVRGEYTMVPVRVLAEIAGGTFCENKDTLSSVITLSDKRQLLFVRGSIVCQIDDEVRSMYCEAIHRNGELLISAEWFAECVLNMFVSSCNGVIYITDHKANLSFYMADLIKRLLKDEVGDDYELDILNASQGQKAY